MFFPQTSVAGASIEPAGSNITGCDTLFNFQSDVRRYLNVLDTSHSRMNLETEEQLTRRGTRVLVPGSYASLSDKSTCGTEASSKRHHDDVVVHTK
jgi:hypothetical protein